MLTYIRHSTPTLGLEVLTGTIPLDIHICGYAAMAYVRTKGHEKFSYAEMYTDVEALKGHRQIMDEWLVTMDCMEADTFIDDIPREFSWDKQFKVDKTSMDKENKATFGKPKGDTNFAIYSDGSRDGSRAGCGIAPYKIERKLNFDWQYSFMETKEVHLGTHENFERVFLGDVAVFLSECFGVKWIADFIIYHAKDYHMENKTIAIYTDNQAVIHSLASGEVTSQTVKETTAALNECARMTNAHIYVRWVKGHQAKGQCPGNDLADLRAKESLENGQTVTNPPAKTFREIKNLIKRKMMEHWNYRWKWLCPKEAQCRQTKAWSPQVSLKDARELLLLPRISLSRILLMKTGHNFLNYHQNLVDERMFEKGLIPWYDVQHPYCDFCTDGPYHSDMDLPKQSAIHVLSECDAFANLRQEVFGDPFASLPLQYNNNNILHFLRKAEIEVLPMMEMQKEYDINIEKEKRHLAKKAKGSQKKTASQPK